MARYRFFTGIAHQATHSAWLQNRLGGTSVQFPCGIDATEFPDSVLDEDGEDVVWFFNDLFYGLHPKLRGRQVLLYHGFGIGPWIDERRARCINDHIDAVFETGRGYMHHHHRYGTMPEKIREAGYFTVFSVPDLPVRPDAVLFTSTCFHHWDHDETMLAILRDLEPSVQGYVSVHPESAPGVIRQYQALCGDRRNLSLIRSQKELMEAYAFCAMNVNGGFSSVMAPFWFRGKPAVFVRGRYGKNPFKGTGWERVRREADCPDFEAVLEESVKISEARQFDATALLKEARPCQAAKRLFYPWNFDEEATFGRVKRLMAELESGMPMAAQEEMALAA